MPRGQSSATGEWNFRVKRLVCPTCLRKGLYSDYVYENYRYRQAYICMYRNCQSRNVYETLFRKSDDADVIRVNPQLVKYE